MMDEALGLVCRPTFAFTDRRGTSEVFVFDTDLHIYRFRARCRHRSFQRYPQVSSELVL